MGIVNIADLLNGPPTKQALEVLRRAPALAHTVTHAPVVRVSLKIQRLLRDRSLTVAQVRDICCDEFSEGAYNLAIKNMKEDGLLREVKSMTGDAYFTRRAFGVQESAQ